MTQPLFVNINPTFISRLTREASPDTLFTPSMSQALRWLSDPAIPVAGIYLNPNDPSYSALRFLEIVSQLRPVTPVFLIDGADEIQTDAQHLLLEAANIKGVFKGHESFANFIEKLNFVESPALQKIKKREGNDSEHEGYVVVPIIDFIHSKHYFFDVYVEDEHKTLSLFATAGSPIEPEYLAQLSAKTPWLYVSEASITEVRTNIAHASTTYLNQEDFPSSWKTAEAMFKAKTILKDLQLSGPSDHLVEQTHVALGELFHLVSELGTGTKLQKFIDQAKDSDRNIACASLSILMCKILKFEKSAIVEILGLASFFQDISLYQTPFGNISEMRPEELSPEALKYYHQHPLLSADLVATHTSVPEVTLQVMRQHHERKDRSGFPNRIGGMQLHPMAEALSLINAYLDHPENFHDFEREVYAHYSDRMVTAFKNILKATEAKAELKAA